MPRELSNVETAANAIGLTGEYCRMVAIVRESETAIAEAAAQHGKSHSQFQYALLDLSGPVAGFTKLRNWRATLAVLERTRDAIEEAVFCIREKEAELDILRRDQSGQNETDSALTQVKIDRMEWSIGLAKRSMGGAIRKLATYTLQWRELERQIRAELGKAEDEPITEEDFERDEERFHIQKAFQQALQAHRAHGYVDHGNMIYLDDIGICGTMAQDDIRQYLDGERRYREVNPQHIHEVHALERDFLSRMADKYHGCGVSLATAKGLLPGILRDSVLKLEGG